MAQWVGVSLVMTAPKRRLKRREPSFDLATLARMGLPTAWAAATRLLTRGGADSFSAGGGGEGKVDDALFLLLLVQPDIAKGDAGLFHDFQTAGAILSGITGAPAVELGLEKLERRGDSAGTGAPKRARRQ
jgi:hypothetical protein